MSVKWTTSSVKPINRPAPVPAVPAGELLYLCFWPTGTGDVSWTSLNKDKTNYLIQLHHLASLSAVRSRVLIVIINSRAASVTLKIKSKTVTIIRNRENYETTKFFPFLSVQYDPGGSWWFPGKGIWSSSRQKVENKLQDFFFFFWCNFQELTVTMFTFTLCSAWKYAGRCDKRLSSKRSKILVLMASETLLLDCGSSGGI